MSLGERIARFRKLHDWTQKEMAAKLDVHAAHLSRWETDRVKPNLGTLRRIAETLGVSIEDLTRDDSAPESQLEDQEFIRYLRELEQLDDEDRFVVKRVIEAMLTKKRVKKALGEAG